eukprot:GEMP01024368.1.p1 GENE.GEMP01024368.1~~GEMP01024368.1.p1  ORF type:complete len:644 (+),score=146.56 GEMP01024368.1:232-2163(+)
MHKLLCPESGINRYSTHGSPHDTSQTEEAKVSCIVAYPMYCIPLMVVLEMEVLESHEVLLARNVLLQQKSGDVEPVIFVSHQWVSDVHPDPLGEQFAVLQQAIRRLLAGYEVRSDWLHSLFGLKDHIDSSWPVLLQNARVWYDYFSVPQDSSSRATQQLAIESIPAYIEMSTVTFVLAPAIDHRSRVDINEEVLLCDYYAWQRRGWCRLELFATHLKVNARPPVVIRSENYMQFMMAGRHACVARVAEGDFTCCASDHQRMNLDGTVSTLKCDKPALFGVLRALITNRVMYERANGNLRLARQLRAHRYIWLRDLLPVDKNCSDRNMTLSEFLAEYEFTSPHEFDGGWTPLRLACISAHVNVVRQLIDDKADLEANLKGPSVDFSVEKGMNILVHLIQICCCPEHEEILDLLVSHDAKLCSSKHMDALSSASISGSVAKRGAHWLFRAFPDWDVNQMSQGADGMTRWALFVSISVGADIDHIRNLCARNADVSIQSWPLELNAFYAACTVCPTSSPEVAEYILQILQKNQPGDDACSSTSTGVQPVHGCVNRCTAAPWVLRLVLKAFRATKWGPTTFIDLLLFGMGSTPLIGAANEGKHRVCKWLLDQNADASITNADGETPLMIAQKRGFTRVVDALRGTSE